MATKISITKDTVFTSESGQLANNTTLFVKWIERAKSDTDSTDSDFSATESELEHADIEIKISCDTTNLTIVCKSMPSNDYSCSIYLSNSRHQNLKIFSDGQPVSINFTKCETVGSTIGMGGQCQHDINFVQSQIDRQEINGQSIDISLVDCKMSGSEVEIWSSYAGDGTIKIDGSVIDSTKITIHGEDNKIFRSKFIDSTISFESTAEVTESTFDKCTIFAHNDHVGSNSLSIPFESLSPDCQTLYHDVDKPDN